MEPSQLARCARDLAHDAARGEPVLVDALQLLDRAVGADVLNSSVAVPMDGAAPARITMLHAAPLSATEEQDWLRLIPTHPFARNLASAGLRTSRLTDHMSIRELEALELWELLLRPRGSRYQLAATLTGGPASLTLLSLWREGKDFSDVECALVDVVRRALAAALEFRAALLDLETLAGPSVPREPLTARQAEVCALVARGLTNAQVATRLGVSERTVRKHLEDVFTRTGCTSRAAVATWWASRPGVADPPLAGAGGRTGS